MGWGLAAAVTAIGLGALIRGVGPEENVPLPPVRAVELADAARTAGCEVRRARPREATEPPVDGPRGPRVEPGVYERPLRNAEMASAVRQGLIVIHHRPQVDRMVIDDLRTIQKAVPDGTIVTVNPALPEFEVAVTAYRRLLGCRKYSPRTIDAIQLFRGRFIGSGPDR